MASTPGSRSASSAHGSARGSGRGPRRHAAPAPAAPAVTPTPSRRAATAEPPSSRPSIRTPLGHAASRDLLASVRRNNNNTNAPTPHARAARLALNQRRAAMFTPGKVRRRSLMGQRETPMAILRNLGRALAPNSRPIASSPRDKPSSIAPISEQDDDDDDDDGLPIDRPCLSLPLDDDVDDDLQPPRTSGLEEENYTVQSIELPRRAVSEQPGPRLSRSSFGNVRVSDVFGNIDDPTEDIRRQSDFFPGLLEDLQARAAAADLTYDRIDVDPTQRTTLGRESDFGLQLPAGLDDQTTFLLSEPPAEAERGPAADSPLADYSLGEVVAAERQQQQRWPDVSLAQDHDIDMAEGDYDTADLTAAQDKPSRRAPEPRKAQKRISRHGIKYPPLPPSFVKRVAQTALRSSGLSNPRVSADTLAALTQASEWFFEQLGDDLGAYANHAKRKTVDESDVATLMRRQRQIGPEATMFSLAQRHLPRELLQGLRMPVPQPVRRRRVRRSHGNDDQDAAEVS